MIVVFYAHAPLPPLKARSPKAHAAMPAYDTAEVTAWAKVPPIGVNNKMAIIAIAKIADSSLGFRYITGVMYLE